MVEKVVVFLALGVGVAINSCLAANHLWENWYSPYIYTDIKIIGVETVCLLIFEGLVALDIGISLVRRINPPRELPEF